MTISIAQARLYRQFDQFLRTVAATSAVFALIELLAGGLLGMPTITAIGAIIATFVLGLLASRWVLKHKSVEVAGILASLMFLATPVAYVAIFQALLPVGIFFLIAGGSLPMIFRSRRLFLVVTAAAVLASLLLGLASLVPPIFPQPAPWIAVAFTLTNLPVCAALMSLLFYFIWLNFSASLDLAEQTNSDLRGLQATLAAQVAERTAALATALAEVQARADAQAALIAENQAQRDTIRDLSVPVLPIDASTLVIPLVGMLDGERLNTLLNRALDAIAARPARRLVLDITGVPMIDTQVAQGLMRVPQAARLLGAEVVLVGISPEVAQTVVGLGLDFAGLRTASTLHDALGGSARAAAIAVR